MRLFGWSITLYILFHFFRVATPWWSAFTDPIEALIGLTAIATGLIAVRRARGFPLLLLGVAAALFIWRGFHLEGAVASFLALEELLPMVRVVPILGQAFIERGYAEAAVAVVRSAGARPLALYGGIAVFSQLIGAAIAVTGLIVVYGLLAGLAEEGSDESERFLTGSILRGYVGSYYWSPNSPVLAVAIVLTGAPLAATIGQGLLLATCGMLIALAVEVMRRRGRRPAYAPRPVSLGGGPTPWPRAVEFLIILFLLIALVVLSEQTTPIGLLVTIPLLTVLFALALFASTAGGNLIRRTGSAVGRMNDVWWRDLARRPKEATLLLSAGTVIGALTATDAGGLTFQFLREFLPNTAFTWIVAPQLLILLLSLIGLTPVPAALLLASAIQPAALALGPDLVSLAIAGGAAVTLVIAPVSVPLLMLSGFNGRSISEMGLRWNFAFAVLLLVTNVVLLEGLHLLRGLPV